jgi:hypothetical protein
LPVSHPCSLCRDVGTLGRLRDPSGRCFARSLSFGPAGDAHDHVSTEGAHDQSLIRGHHTVPVTGCCGVPASLSAERACGAVLQASGAGMLSLNQAPRAGNARQEMSSAPPRKQSPLKIDACWTTVFYCTSAVNCLILIYHRFPWFDGSFRAGANELNPRLHSCLRSAVYVRPQPHPYQHPHWSLRPRQRHRARGPRLRCMQRAASAAPV